MSERAMVMQHCTCEYLDPDIAVYNHETSCPVYIKWAHQLQDSIEGVKPMELRDTFENGDYCQVRFERHHPDKGSEPFWRNALWAGVDNMAFYVVYADCTKEAILVQHRERIRKPQ